MYWLPSSLQCQDYKDGADWMIGYVTTINTPGSAHNNYHQQGITVSLWYDGVNKREVYCVHIAVPVTDHRVIKKYVIKDTGVRGSQQQEIDRMTEPKSGDEVNSEEER